MNVTKRHSSRQAIKLGAKQLGITEGAFYDLIMSKINDTAIDDSAMKTISFLELN